MIRHCQYEFCAKPFTSTRYHSAPTRKFCSRRCKTLYWMHAHRRRWNRMMATSNRRHRASETPAQREHRLARMREYRRVNRVALKLRRAA